MSFPPSFSLLLPTPPPHSSSSLLLPTPPSLSSSPLPLPPTVGPLTIFWKRTGIVNSYYIDLCTANCVYMGRRRNVQIICFTVQLVIPYQPTSTSCCVVPLATNCQGPTHKPIIISPKVNILTLFWSSVECGSHFHQYFGEVVLLVMARMKEY